MEIMLDEQIAVNESQSVVGVLTQDPCPRNPILDWDVLGTIALNPKHSHLGHEEVDLDAFAGDSPCDYIQDFIKSKGLKLDDVVAYPITKYKLCDINLALGDSRGCSPDSSIIGLVYAQKSKIREWFGVKKFTQAVERQTHKAFFNELDTLSRYINGKVYEIRTYLVATEEYKRYGADSLKYGELLDVCGGYYELGHATESLKESVLTAVETTRQQAA